jgi:RHS repeat-associated protein
VTDAAGNVLSQYAYLPFGDSAPPSVAACWSGTCGSATGTAFGYAGYRYDPETGLYHTGARYYDPRQGRFLQRDPIGQAGDVNVYRYAENAPLVFTDPSGLMVSTAANTGWGLILQLNPIGTAEAQIVIPMPAPPLGMKSTSVDAATQAAASYLTRILSSDNSDPVYYHRLQSPTQTPETAALQQQSGDIWGATARRGLAPTVQAYRGPLPQGAQGVEFVTNVDPHPGSGGSFPGGQARWYGNLTAGVKINDQGYAVIPVIITNEYAGFSMIYQPCSPFGEVRIAMGWRATPTTLDACLVGSKLSAIVMLQAVFSEMLESINGK